MQGDVQPDLATMRLNFGGCHSSNISGIAAMLAGLKETCALIISAYFVDGSDGSTWKSLNCDLRSVFGKSFSIMPSKYIQE